MYFPVRSPIVLPFSNLGLCIRQSSERYVCVSKIFTVWSIGKKPFESDTKKSLCLQPNRELKSPLPQSIHFLMLNNGLSLFLKSHKHLTYDLMMRNLRELCIPHQCINHFVYQKRIISVLFMINQHVHF